MRRFMERNGDDQGDDPGRARIKCCGKLVRHQINAPVKRCELGLPVFVPVGDMGQATKFAATFHKDTWKWRDVDNSALGLLLLFKQTNSITDRTTVSSPATIVKC